MYDVVIVGAGPAGATLARLIGERTRVLLIDKRPLGAMASPDAPGKPCGGLLAPQAQRELALQGLGLPTGVARGPQLFAVRTLDLPSGAERLYQRFYVNVDREAFDRWLVSLVPDSVERLFGWRVTGVERDDAGPFVHLRSASGSHASVRTRLVVGADGPSSTVRTSLAAPPVDRYVAVQAMMRGGDHAPHYGAVFDERLTDFYGWTVPKGDLTLVGAAFPAGPGLMDRFDAFVDGMQAAGIALGEELGREAAPVARPSSPRQIVLGDGELLLAGEAAGLISPSSAEGMSYALRSGRLLARAVEAGAATASRRYRLLAAPLCAEVVARMGKRAVIQQPAVRRLIMTSGVGAIRTPTAAPPRPARA